jgi:hypothetical protein
LKPVFIIAIIAVAMIGVMVPSVFAFEREIDEDFFIVYGKCDTEWIMDDEDDDREFIEIILGLTRSSEDGCKDLEYTTYTVSQVKDYKIDFEKIDNNSRSSILTIFTEESSKDGMFIIPDDWVLGNPLPASDNFEYKGVKEIKIGDKLIEAHAFSSDPITREDDEMKMTFNSSMSFEKDSGIMVSISHEINIVKGDHEGQASYQIKAIDIFQKERLEIAPFVDTTKDPQHYIDRYNNEPTYKEWFDENYSQYSSIYEAVGLEEPVAVVESVIDYTPEPEYIPEPTVEVADTSNCGAGTESVNGICKVIQTETTETSDGGGCLIATATYGSEMAPQVQQLRELRDNQLLQTESGTAFMSTFNDIYYSFSPIIADMEREHPLFKDAVKLAITPMISTLSLMESAESESEVLSIGISVIVLNLGMYLAVPAVVVIGVRKRF